MRRPLLTMLGLLLLAPAGFLSGGSQETEKPKVKQTVGRLYSPIGTLLQRQMVGAPWRWGPWQLPELYAALMAGDELVALPGTRAEIDLREGDVRLSLRGNLPDLSPSPVLESAVVLRPPGQRDFSFVLDRGRVVLANRKDKGEVRGVVIQDSRGIMELGLDKGSQVGIERLSSWPAGAPLDKTVRLMIVVVKGKAEVVVDSEKYLVQAPALFELEVTPRVATRGPLPLKKLPDWLAPGDEPGARTRAVHAAVEHVRRRLAEKPAATTFAEIFKEPNPLRRRLAVLSAAALDDFEVVLTGLEDPQHPGVRETAVLALTQPITRGRSMELVDYLRKKLNPGRAEIVMTLLRGFGEEDRARPETYDILIRYLQHDQLLVRELARTNLYALVPAGKEIAYDAAAPTEERARAQAAWRKLIPEGQVPRLP